jgi:hypothetical protein
MALTKYYYKAYGLSIGSEIPIPPLETSKVTTVDLTIKRRRLLESPPLGSTKVHRAGLNARFAQNSHNCLWLDWSPLVAFMAINGNELLVETTENDAELIALFTLSEALGLVLFQKNYFLLHGSAVQIGGQGIIFLGEPGAGKSTSVAAFAQKGVSVVSDDMVCIHINESGSPKLIPSFSQIKIWENSVVGLQLQKENLSLVREGTTKFSWHDSIVFEENPVPLKQIFVLTNPKDSVRLPGELPKSQVPVELISYFPLPDALLNGVALKDYFEKSVVLAQRVPVLKMNRPEDFAKLYEFVEHLKKCYQ